MGVIPPQLTPEMVNRLRLHDIASFQKGVIVCILIYLLAIVAQLFLPPDLRPILGIGVLIVLLLCTIFVFLLATKLYSTGLGIFLGILTLIPLVGLIVLLVVNGKATRILRENDIEVGIMGAKSRVD